MFWIILGCIVLFILIIIFSPVRVYVSYIDKKPAVILKYLFLKFDILKKTKKSDKKEKASKKETKKEKKPEKEKKKLVPEGKKEKILFIKNIADSGGRAFRKITKSIKIKKIFIDIRVSDMDACDCAVKFGKTNIMVYNALSYLGVFVKLKKKSINISCVYNMPECIYNISFCVSLTPAAAIAAAFAFIFRFFGNNIKANKAKADKTEDKSI